MKSKSANKEFVCPFMKKKDANNYAIISFLCFIFLLQAFADPFNALDNLYGQIVYPLAFIMTMVFGFLGRSEGLAKIAVICSIAFTIIATAIFCATHFGFV
jgi:hypothetical protein